MPSIGIDGVGHNTEDDTHGPNEGGPHERLKLMRLDEINNWEVKDDVEEETQHILSGTSSAFIIVSFALVFAWGVSLPSGQSVLEVQILREYRAEHERDCLAFDRSVTKKSMHSSERQTSIICLKSEEHDTSHNTEDKW